MARSPLSFPPGFRFGVATASFQIEGATTEDGRGPSIWDTRVKTKGLIQGGDTADVADDYYQRYAEDVVAMADLGLNAYRFSVAWPRIQPAGSGAVNRAGFDFYHRVLDELERHGIEPIVTLYHWDLPQPLEDAGGWPNRDTAYRFEEYARLAIEEFGGRIRHWTTLNEPWCSSFLGYAAGAHAPSRTEPAAAFAAAHHLNLAHGLGYHAIKKAAPNVEVSLVNNCHVPRPWNWANPADVDACRQIDALANRFFVDPFIHGCYPEDLLEDTQTVTDWSFVHPGDLELMKDTVDLFGVNYYSSHIVRRNDNPDHRSGEDGHGSTRGWAWPGAEHIEFMPVMEPRTTMGWNQDWSALHGHLVRLHRDTGKPLMVTENGASFDDVVSPDGRIHDSQRVQYLHDHMTAVLMAIEDGVDVRGYVVWTLMDNFEWSYGFSKRFGLLWVDYDTLRRTWKDSAYWYRETIRTGRVIPVKEAPSLGPTPPASF